MIKSNRAKLQQLDLDSNVQSQIADALVMVVILNIIDSEGN
jgi:hypothetical protein